MLETKRGVSALNWKDTGKFLWRRIFVRGSTKVADFALAGQKALRAGLGFAHGAVPLYYLGLAPYENARHFLGSKRAQLGELDGRSAEPLWERTAAARYVSAEEILSQ